MATELSSKKILFITGFALFSLFFGAGNLLLPPLLGYKTGANWPFVVLGFLLTAVIIPIFGIIAHARLQGTLYDFGKKVSHHFSLVYCVLIYAIAVAIPSPRTAAATHEIAIHPIFGSSPLLTSSVYFSLVLLFVLNRSRILGLIGKFLTPLIVIMLLAVIGIGLFSSDLSTGVAQLKAPFISGILEGYQTFDAIGAVVSGAVIIISLNYVTIGEFATKKKLIVKAGLMAGFGLLIIYCGLIATGTYFGAEININENLSSDMQRAILLRSISIASLGEFGNTILSVLISLACFSTAVGIIAGTADYFKGLLNNSNNVFIVTSIIASAMGVVVGQLDFNSIIVIAVPFLLFIYPITIVLILLNVLPQRYSTRLVFRAVVVTTFIFSIPDVLLFVFPSEELKALFYHLPMARYNMGWIIPALISFLISATIVSKNKALPQH